MHAAPGDVALYNSALPVFAHAGITSENVAAQYGVSREVQDGFAARSHALAAAAQATGKFREEIVPVPTVQKDPKTGGYGGWQERGWVGGVGGVRERRVGG